MHVPELSLYWTVYEKRNLDNCLGFQKWYIYNMWSRKLVYVDYGHILRLMGHEPNICDSKQQEIMAFITINKALRVYMCWRLFSVHHCRTLTYSILKFCLWWHSIFLYSCWNFIWPKRRIIEVEFSNFISYINQIPECLKASCKRTLHWVMYVYIYIYIYLCVPVYYIQIAYTEQCCIFLYMLAHKLTQLIIHWLQESIADI